MKEIYRRATADYREFNAPNDRTDAESDAMAAAMEGLIETAYRTPPRSDAERRDFVEMLIETGSFDTKDMVALQTLRDSMLAN